jgi:hypothetical protein
VACISLNREIGKGEVIGGNILVRGTLAQIGKGDGSQLTIPLPEACIRRRFQDFFAKRGHGFGK